MFLRRYMRPYLGVVVLASCCSIILGFLASLLVSLLGPSLQILMLGRTDTTLSFAQLLGRPIGTLLSSLTGRSSINATELVEYLPGLLLMVVAIKSTLSLCQTYLWERTGEQISRDMRRDTMKLYLNLSPMVRKSRENTEIEASLSSCITTDIKLIREYFVHFYGGFPRELLQVLFLTGVLLALSPSLFALFFLFFLIIFVRVFVKI